MAGLLTRSALPGEVIAGNTTATVSADARGLGSISPDDVTKCLQGSMLRNSQRFKQLTPPSLTAELVIV